LLIYHAKLDAWFQPGGHADEGEKITAVSLREATEETGLSLQMLGEQVFDIDIHLIPARKTEIAHFHYDVRFVFEADQDQLPTISAESKDLRWIPLSEIKNFNSEASIMRMVQKTAFI
jgi:8-oxo-dGTP pyrophosphatase MutT (NUDIX family)